MGPSLLVLAGLAVGLLPGVPPVHVNPHLLYFVVLPPLLYAAAVDLVLADLRAVARSVSVLATGLVVASAVVVAYVVHLCRPEISWRVGLVLGAVLASTDPVAVAALARRLGLPPRLLALVQGESLLNDATSLLLFRVVVGGVVAGHFAGPTSLLLQFVWLGVGGALIGIVCALLVKVLRQHTHHAGAHSLLVILTPYPVFVLAELAHTSGVTAVVAGGLVLSHLHLGPASGVRKTLVFGLESVVFAAIGLQLPTLVRDLPSDEQGFALAALAITGALLATRLLWVFGTVRRWRVVAVATWAGTRGVVPLVAALSIPVSLDGGMPFPHRPLLLVLATTCTAITLVVQGLTVGPLVRRTKLGHSG